MNQPSHDSKNDKLRTDRWADRIVGIASALCIALVMVAARPAESVEIYKKGDFSARVDTTLSVGAAVRTQKRDADLVFFANGGGATNPEFLNRDDGNLNYDQWDVTSTQTKALIELDARWRNFGLFVRANASYDPIQNCKDCTRRTDLTGAARHRSSVLDGGVIGAHFTVLDAWVDGQFRIAGHPFEIRAGRQVINWGQGVFIQGGINQTNALEVSKVRSPGVDFGREALFPAGMVRLSTQIYENLGIEAYYQYEWNRTYLDPTGSFFSISDTTGRGADGLYFGLVNRDFLSVPTPPVGDPGADPVIAPQPAVPSIPVLGIDGAPAFPGCGLPTQSSCTPQDLFAVFAGVPGSGDNEPHSQGQWGVALRYFIEPLRSEIAAYYIHYHAKTPSVGFKGKVVNNPLAGGLVNLPTSYFRNYASDVDLIGLSADTEIFGIAIGAELSFRPNDPVVVNPNAILMGTAIGVVNDPFTIKAVDREDRWQVQINGTYNISTGNRVLGPIVEFIRADNMIFIAEAAAVVYPSLNSQVSYAGPPASPTGPNVDENSWGYQLLLQVPYSNPLRIPIDLSFRFIWQHDVDGNTPNQFPFIEKRKGVSAGMTIDYLQTWSFDVGYTNFFGAGTGDVTHDRDFMSATVKFRF